MKNQIRLTLCALALAGCQAYGQNLVQNPGFETGDFTDWTITPAASGSVLHVFTDVPAQYGVQINPHSGNDLAAFGANQGLNDTISQTVATGSGNYEFNFWVNNLDGQNASTFDAVWGGTTLLQITPSSANSGWTEYTFYESATGPTTLSFAGRNAPSYIALDDVSVQAVPDVGSTFVFLGSALAALTIWRRKLA